MRTRNDKLNGRIRERRELEGKKIKWIGCNKKEPEGVKTNQFISVEKILATLEMSLGAAVLNACIPNHLEALALDACFPFTVSRDLSGKNAMCLQ